MGWSETQTIWGPKTGTCYFSDRLVRARLERSASKRFHVARASRMWKASADDNSQRLGCRPDLLIPGKDALGAWIRSTCRFGKWATKRVGLTAGMGRAMWAGVAMLSSNDYLDGILGRLNLLFLCASESICFRALS